MNDKDLKNGFKLNGLVLFHSIHCKVCEKQEELFKKNFIKYVSIECDDDPDYFIKTFDLDVMPETRIYKDDEIVWKKTNLTNDDDIKFIKEILNA